MEAEVGGARLGNQERFEKQVRRAGAMAQMEGPGNRGDADCER